MAFGIRSALLIMATAFSSGVAAKLPAQDADAPGRVNLWACRLIVKPPLRGVLEEAWRRSPTLQRQCRDLADVGAVVEVEWGRRSDSELRAVSRMKSTADGIVVAHVSVPPESNVLALVAHELEHVIERAQGVDYAAESKRPGSGVWEIRRGIFETQRAIDAERQVASELLEGRGVRR